MANSPGGTVIYTRPGCPYCTKIKEVYKMRGWSYTEQVLDQNFTRTQFKSEFGQGATFPQVLIQGSRIGGCTEAIKYLRENNLI